VTIDPSTAVATLVCQLSTQPSATVRIVALVSDGVAVHFVGTTSPVMQLLTLAAASPCAGVAITAYTAAAITAFGGAPVLAATAVPGGTSEVLVVAASPARLYSVTTAGVVTLVSANPVRLSVDHVVSPYTIAFEQHVCAAAAGAVVMVPVCLVVR
jgi:hypothetical protein